jgi:hypothetical protein
MAAAIATRLGHSVSILAILALVACAAGVGALHVLRPDYSFVQHVISNYVNGPQGWIMTASFVALGVGCLALAIGLSQAGPNRLDAVLGIVFLAFVALGAFGVALFPTDPDSDPRSQTGTIHNFLALTSLSCMALAALPLSFSFRRDVRWRPYRRAALLLAIAYILTCVVHFAAMHSGSDFVGVTNRVAVGAMMAWLLTSAFALREVTASGFAMVALQKP